jgi:beta-lactamase class A
MTSPTQKAKPRNRRVRSPKPPQPKTVTPPVEKPLPWWMHGIRAVLSVLGLGTIAGTIVGNSFMSEKIATDKPPASATAKTVLPTIAPLKLGPKMTDLDRQLAESANRYPKLQPSAVFISLTGDRNPYVAINEDVVVSAASTIKIPILVALYQDIDRGIAKLEDRLTLSQKAIAEGAGDLKKQPIGSKVSVLAASVKMMTESDNTATNLIIEYLGGTTELTRRFRAWGLKVTALNQLLPDFEGQNVTTAKELASTIAAIERSKIVSDKSRGEIISLMRQTLRNTLLPQGLSGDAKIAHKTGEIATTIADVGSIELPSGHTYIAAVMVKRPPNDERAAELIRQFSQLAYPQFQTMSPPESNIFPSGKFTH